jgi:hypothetical protein
VAKSSAHERSFTRLVAGASINIASLTVTSQMLSLIIEIDEFKKPETPSALPLPRLLKPLSPNMQPLWTAKL